MFGESGAAKEKRASSHRTGGLSGNMPAKNAKSVARAYAPSLDSFGDISLC
jgi:hypothetical protein